MSRTLARRTVAAAWPHLRVLFILFHVLAVVALSLPSPGNLTNRKAWETKNNQEALAAWAGRLSWLGYDSKEELDADLWNLSQRYVELRRDFIGPFGRYARYTGSQQGWRMFAMPQRHPAELHIDVLEDGTWRPIYRPGADEHDFWGAEFRHNRVRKLLGRFGRAYRGQGYHHLTRYLAGEIFRQYPAVSEARFWLYRYTRRTPEQVRAGQPVAGTYERELRYSTTTPGASAGARP